MVRLGVVKVQVMLQLYIKQELYGLKELKRNIRLFYNMILPTCNISSCM